MKHIIIQTQVYFLIPVLLLLFPNGLVLWWIIAAAIHEIFHMLMLWLFRIKIISLKICITGAKIETASMEPYKELIVALAGPLGAAFFLVFFGFLLLAYFFKVAKFVKYRKLRNLLHFIKLVFGYNLCENKVYAPY